MQKIILFTFLFFTTILYSQKIYINPNGIEISKKEFRKMKRKGKDSLIAISSYDKEFNELFLRRKSAKFNDAKTEIESINQITNNEFNSDIPLLVLYYPSIEEATLSRDEILQSKHWYTSQYAIILRDIQNNLGNMLIVAAPNVYDSSLPGIYNDELDFFHLTYFNSTVRTPHFLWISKENSFIEPIDFIQNYAVLNTRNVTRISNNIKTDSIVTVDKNLKKVDPVKIKKPISKIEYLNFDNSKLFKVLYENDLERKIDTTIRNGYAEYLSEITGQNLKRNDTIIVDYHLYTTNYDFFETENQRRRMLQKKINNTKGMKLVWIAQAGSLYVPEGCYYDYDDKVRKKLATQGPTDGDHFILYPDGTILSLPYDHKDNIDITLLKKGEKTNLRREVNDRPFSLLISKNPLPPPKIFDPSR
ncbi:hypothetical protein LX97_02628 [Nonlabens dokdonensis]|uniref:Uncharacterized protein n=2 Tax=Nonlabens dokdonensis TaxID=328515 RepID=L7WEQ0_NONDD|nr:hypothetical protein [Nonlabens dokdonensis]AGC78609.1 hypothetical protein DDD_3482 [Nonlabens dokdonensis DSW-6]PZX39262.1 hypothetical protein LX97_02628 [Nonlabens dokdonensis]